MKVVKVVQFKNNFLDESSIQKVFQMIKLHTFGRKIDNRYALKIMILPGFGGESLQISGFPCQENLFSAFKI